MLVDSHAHLDDRKFDGDRDEVITRAVNNGVSAIINVGACMKSSARSLKLAENNEFIYAAVGIHPHDAKTADQRAYEKLAAWTEHPKVVAVGEIGLDYYYDLSPRDVQRQVFIRQLDVARQTGKPVIIHDRDAHGDVIDILKREAKGITGVMHCFSGSWEMAKIVMDLGFYISIGGPVTFKNAAKLPEIAVKVPLERLLIETDCPYLAPHPYRGKRNEPAYVGLVAQKIAELRRADYEEILATTAANAERLFNITIR